MNNISEIKSVFAVQVNRYPAMQPQDAVKLLYQNEFGGGHIIPNAAVSLKYLQDEFEKVTYNQSLPYFEDIGGGIVRLNLGAIKPGETTAQAVNAMFVASANRVKGNLDSFKQKIEMLRGLAREECFAFGLPELDVYLEGYAKLGYPMLSHSETYRKAYRPAYRVVFKKYIKYMPLFEAVEKLLRTKESVIIGIDGLCGSGKTTLAGIFSEVYPGDVIRMDDFFLPPPLRTTDRLDEAGGNIHYERFDGEVAEPLRKCVEAEYAVFDCSIMDYSGRKRIKPGKITIIEGSYCMHPLYSDIYDLKVFTTCPKDEQLRRILVRSGEQLYNRFVNEWIPMENRYFERFDIQGKSDVVIDTGENGYIAYSSGDPPNNRYNYTLWGNREARSIAPKVLYHADEQT